MKHFIRYKLITVIYILVFVLAGVVAVVPQASAAGKCGGVCQVTCNDKATFSYDVQRSLTTLDNNPTTGVCAKDKGIKSIGASSAEAGSATPAPAGPSASCTGDSAAPAADSCSPQTTKTCFNAKGNEVNCLFNSYINPLIVVLSAMVGIFVVIGIITGGIMYTTSAGDPQKAAAAKQRISKVLIALVAYIFLYAFLQFIVPGGIG